MILPVPRLAPTTTAVAAAAAMLRRCAVTTNLDPNTLQVEVATWPKRGVLLTTGVVGVVEVQNRRNYA